MEGKEMMTWAVTKKLHNLVRGFECGMEYYSLESLKRKFRYSLIQLRENCPLGKYLAHWEGQIDWQDICQK
jgi:hypothetical protein